MKKSEQNIAPLTIGSFVVDVGLLLVNLDNNGYRSACLCVI